MATANRKKWVEYDDDDKNYEARTEVNKHVQPKEIVENGVTKTVNQTIQITKRIFPVRRVVKQRKNMVKFGDVKDIPRGEHKVGDFAIGELIDIETPDSQEKNEIDLVKKIMKINTDTIKQRKHEQELNQMKEESDEEGKKEEAPKKEKFRFVPQNFEDLSIKIANIIFNETDNNGVELPLRDQEDDFRNFISMILKKFNNRSDYNLKVLRMKNKPKLLGISYLQCSDRNRIEEIERLLHDQIYNNCILEIGKPEISHQKPRDPNFKDNKDRGTYIKKY